MVGCQAFWILKLKFTYFSDIPSVLFKDAFVKLLHFDHCIWDIVIFPQEKSASKMPFYLSCSSDFIIVGFFFLY